MRRLEKYSKVSKNLTGEVFHTLSVFSSQLFGNSFIGASYMSYTVLKTVWNLIVFFFLVFF